MHNYKRMSYLQLIELQEVAYNAALLTKYNVNREHLLGISIQARNEIDERNKSH